MKKFLLLTFIALSSTANAYELEACIDYCVDSIEDNRHLKACIEQCEVEFPAIYGEKNFCETYEECDEDRDPYTPLF